MRTASWRGSALSIACSLALNGAGKLTLTKDGVTAATLDYTGSVPKATGTVTLF